jgi:hypothetical protein
MDPGLAPMREYIGPGKALGQLAGAAHRSTLWGVDGYIGAHEAQVMARPTVARNGMNDDVVFEESTLGPRRSRRAISGVRRSTGVV